jgi:hypothetical protein
MIERHEDPGNASLPPHMLVEEIAVRFQLRWSTAPSGSGRRATT